MVNTQAEGDVSVRRVDARRNYDRIVNVATGATVTSVVTVSAAGVIRINPNARLAARTTYRVNLGSNLAGTTLITDVAGAAMVPVSWTFTTGN